MIMRMKLLMALLCLLPTCDCCCNRRNNRNDYPTPQLLFPGLSEWAASLGSSDASSFLDSLASSVAGLVPGGQFFDPITKGIKSMMNSLSGAENSFVNFVDKSNAVAAVADIKAKLVTVENRMKEVQHKISTGANCNIPLHIALDKCEEILQKFSYEWGPLYKSGNSLVSAPSLVSFTRIYPGVALMGFKEYPERRRHILEEMELLLSTLKKYRDSAVSKRMSYVQRSKLFRTSCDVSCEDSYYKVVSCDSCYNVKCDTLTIFTANYSVDLFNYYKNELLNKYNEYFKNPVQKMEEFVQQLKKML